MTNHTVSNHADLRERTKTMSRHGDRRGQIADFRDSFETINWLYLLFKCGIKTKTHFEWLLWHWSSLGQLNLEPTRPNGLVGCKVPTDLVKISVKEATHMGFHYITLYIFWSLFRCLTQRCFQVVSIFYSGVHNGTFKPRTRSVRSSWWLVGWRPSPRSPSWRNQARIKWTLRRTWNCRWSVCFFRHWIPKNWAKRWISYWKTLSEIQTFAKWMPAGIQ